MVVMLKMSGMAEMERTCTWVIDGDSQGKCGKPAHSRFVKLEGPGDPHGRMMFFVDLCDEHWDEARPSLGR
jgi:hypothetical protein